MLVDWSRSPSSAQSRLVPIRGETVRARSAERKPDCAFLSGRRPPAAAGVHRARLMRAQDMRDAPDQNAPYIRRPARGAALPGSHAFAGKRAASVTFPKRHAVRVREQQHVLVGIDSDEPEAEGTIDDFPVLD